MRACLSTVTVVLLSILFVSAQTQLVPVGAIELPGVEGRIDHLAFEASSQRLYVAALGNDTVEVIDTKAGRFVKSLSGFREPQGVAILPRPRRIAVAEGEAGSVRLLHEADSAPAKVVRIGSDPDNLRYDERAKRLYVGYGAGALAAIDATSGSMSAEVKLGGHPESFQLEGSGPRIFVNVPESGQIAVVDRTTMRVVASWQQFQSHGPGRDCEGGPHVAPRAGTEQAVRRRPASRGANGADTRLRRPMILTPHTRTSTLARQRNRTLEEQS